MSNILNIYRTESTEFVRLVYYLELVTEGMDWSKFNATVGLSFTESGLLIPRMWFRELSAYIERSQVCILFIFLLMSNINTVINNLSGV